MRLELRGVNVENKIYLNQYAAYWKASEKHKKLMGSNPAYALSKLPAEKMQEEARKFIVKRLEEKSIMTVYGERTEYHQICDMLQERRGKEKSFTDLEKSKWLLVLKAWMLKHNIPLTQTVHLAGKPERYGKSKLVRYFELLLEDVQPEDVRDEVLKDIWELDKLNIELKTTPTKNYRTIRFTEIYQADIKEELKKAIYVQLKQENVSSVAREMTAMRRLSRYLKEKHPEIESCQDISRAIVEVYLTYLNTESLQTKEFRSELNRLRSVLEMVGKLYHYEQLDNIILNRDIPPSTRAEFKTYSDAELKRINSFLVKVDEQTARLMIIHQMLGTRISDTLTLRTDCLIEKGNEVIIRINQPKSHYYEKPISMELASLIKAAIKYTKEKIGDTEYIFANENNPKVPWTYGRICDRILRLIYKEDIRDDNGQLFGFNSHMYRHYYGVKLTEMHLDDWTIARLLGHSSLRNVRYYRKMSNQILADETRAVRNKLSQIILDNLDGWGEEYEQIRYDDSLQ